MRTFRRAQDNRRSPITPQAPDVPAMEKSDRPAFDVRHVAALHRGLLALLAVAILALLPVILRGGASGQAWTESRTQLRPWGIATPQADTPEPPMSRQVAPARP